MLLIAFLVNIRSLVFPALKVTFHFLAQVETVFRSRFSRFTVSDVSVAVAMSVVSSAKMCGVDSRLSMISLMKRMNKIGPNREP